MSTLTHEPRTSSSELHDPPLPVKAKLAAAWSSLMFLYIYVDHLNLYKPGVVADLLAGRVFEFEASQTFVIVALTLVGIPAVMVVLSAALPARVNRPLNLVLGALYVPVSLFNLSGGEWLGFYGLGVGLEVLVLAFVLRSAWTWPRTGASSLG